MKTLILILFCAILPKAYASELRVIYNELGFPRCLYHESRPKLGILLFWDENHRTEKREVYYGRINNLITQEGEYLNINHCKKSLNIKNVNGKELDISQVIHDQKIEEFKLNPELVEKLSQIKKGFKRFFDSDFFSQKENVINAFEPFDIKKYRNIIKDFNQLTSTELMHSWIAQKNLPADCSQLIGSCDYYLCKEKERPCGSNGYFLNFGYVYCSQSMEHLMTEVSPEGKVWLKTVATCLQEKTENMHKDLTCQEVKKQAIESHDSCYSKINFCSLPPRDIALVLNMIKKELKDLRIVREGFEVLFSCGARK